jgi:(1->4)-alpha-D-glucan 1-alpha-D-glucosylmutase
LWDLRLVDPDNRGLVDFDRRTSMLETIDQKRAAAPETLIDNLLDHWHGGCIKMFVTQRALQYRGQNSLLFQEGEFIPLEVTGRHSDNVVAFLRRYNRQYVLTAVPRWLSQIAELPSKSRPQVDWQDTAICLPPGSPGKWTNIFTGKTLVSNQSDGNSVSLDHLLKHFHVSLLDASASD